VSSLGFMFRLDFGAGRAFKPQRPALGVGAALLGVTGTTTDAALFGDGNRSCGSHLGNGMRFVSGCGYACACACVPYAWPATAVKIHPSMIQRHFGSVCIDGDTCFR
jgi:hypothetical protein